MGDWRISAGVGGVLVLIGAAMIRGHYRSWMRQEADASLDDSDLHHFQTQFRRRVQTSALIALLGIAIPLGDSRIVWNLGPLWSALYWMGVLATTGLIVLLGIADYISTKAYNRAALSRVRRKQRELEAEVQRLRSRHNGRD